MKYLKVMFGNRSGADKDLEYNEVIIKDNVTGEETKSNINDIVEYLEMNI